MASIPVFVGLDYHQDAVQVCVVDSTGRVLENKSVANSAAAVGIVELLDQGLAEVAENFRGTLPKRSLDSRRASRGTHVDESADPRRRAETDGSDRRRSAGEKTAGIQGGGLGDDHDVAGRDRPLRSLSQREATGELLRRHSAERVERRTSGRRRFDPLPQPATANGAHRVGPSPTSHPCLLRRTVAKVGRGDAQPRQTQECRHRRGGQSLDSLDVPRSPTTGSDHIKTSAQARQKGAAPSVFTRVSWEYPRTKTGERKPRSQNTIGPGNPMAKHAEWINQSIYSTRRR